MGNNCVNIFEIGLQVKVLIKEIFHATQQLDED